MSWQHYAGCAADGYRNMWVDYSKSCLVSKGHVIHVVDPRHNSGYQVYVTHMHRDGNPDAICDTLEEAQAMALVLHRMGET